MNHQMLLKNYRGENIPKLILHCQWYPDEKPEKDTKIKL